MSISRRQFVVGAALAGPFAGLLANPELVAARSRPSGYGPIGPVPDITTGEMTLSLPDGFEYRSIAVAGSIMAEGNVTPGACDGMECFNARNGRVRLVRSHETRAQGGVGDAARAPANSNPYDPVCNGGTTTIEVDLRGGNRRWRDVSSWSSLNGTYFNCSGGASTYRTCVLV